MAPGVTIRWTDLADRTDRLRAANLYEAPAKQRPAPATPLPKENPGHLRPWDEASGKAVVASGPAAAASILLEPRFNTAPNTPRTLSGFPGLDDNLTAVPPDTMGAVGPQHVVTALNSEILIQDRRGRSLSRVILEDFWRPAGALDFATDPRVFFDSAAQRWVQCVVADPQTPRSALYVGVSQTADPTGNWNLFRVATDENQWLDFPTLGIAGDWVIVTTNNFSLAGNRYVRTNVYVFTKADLAAGRGAFRVFPDVNFSGVPAFDPTGSLAGRAVIVSTVGGNLNGQGVLRISEIRGRPGEEQLISNAATFRVDQTWAFELPPDRQAPQRDSRFLIDTNDDRMQSCTVRNNNIWCAHQVFLPALNPTRSSVQWIQFAAEPVTSAAPAGYRVATRGLIDDPASRQYFAFPSIAANRNNDVLLGYTRFAADQFPSANFAFRAASDPPGQFQADSVFKPGEASYRRGTTRNRWGDYSNTIVDPVDDLSFWTVQQYAAALTNTGTSRWATWWGLITPVTSPCVYSVAPVSFNLPASGGTVTVQVSTRPGCRWMAAPNAGFVSATAGSPGDGLGTLTLTIAPNRTINARSASVRAGDTDIAIAQEAGAPAIDLAVTSLTAPATATLGQPFPVSARVVNDGNLAAAAFPLGFFLFQTSNLTASARISTGFACNFTSGLPPGQAANCAGEIRLPANIAPGTYQIAAIADPDSVLALPDRSRTARLADSGPLTVLAPAGAPRLSAASIVHAATAESAPLSPNLIIVIYGANLGPANLTTLTLDSSGRVANSLAGTRVLFDGIAAPLVYVSANQLSAIVPSAVAGRASTRLQVIANDLPSEVVTLPVAAATPGIFTLNFSGRGPGAILNQDSSLNAGARPAARGEVIQIYATGLGAISGSNLDGAVPSTPIAISAAASLRVTIGGAAATVLYAGVAPGLTIGVTQINVVVPPDAPVGPAVPVRLLLSNVSSGEGVTVAIR